MKQAALRITKIDNRGRVWFTIGGINYCTNEIGEGLFVDDLPGWSANQLLGTSQFNLKCSRSAMRGRIKKYFTLE